MYPLLSDIFSVAQDISAKDIVDIAILSAVFFVLLNIIRSTRSQVALRGLALILGSIFLLYLITIVASLDATKALLERLWIVFVLIFLIVFQNEFKKSLTEFGRLPIFRVFFRQEVAPLEEIIKAAGRLSEKRVGALICLERRTSLRNYIETGTELDALVTVELLRTIFAVYTPLHDGAVIIRNNRVAAAGCLLPLTEQKLNKDLGTRHRAGVGLGEETDAVVIIVSEETGTISLTYDGQLFRPETPDTLRQKLRDVFEIDEDDDDGED
ncbi:MAG: diadenylate cyclase CdaA [Candidatus Sumerlaeia bacterium]|nr:diadenylate cyclase CdaA [Candidatus Sumerlaeia bacterium]